MLNLTLSARTSVPKYAFGTLTINFKSPISCSVFQASDASSPHHPFQAALTTGHLSATYSKIVLLYSSQSVHMTCFSRDGSDDACFCFRPLLVCVCSFSFALFLLPLFSQFLYLHDVVFFCFSPPFPNHFYNGASLTFTDNNLFK